MSRLCCFCHQE